MEQFLCFFFFLPPPQPSQSGWESLQSILWMYLSWLVSIYTFEKVESGWSPSASPLLDRSHVIGWAGLAGVFKILGDCLLASGTRETACHIVVWRPVPLKDLSSDLWRAFSSKWVVVYKELTNFHWKFPERKRSPSFWNHPIWSSWKPSLLELRVSPSVFEGVSSKLVCGTKGVAPIRALFCNAALLAAWSSAWFPHALPCSLFGVLYSGRLKPQRAKGLPIGAWGFGQHIWLGALRWSSGLFPSK